MLLEYGNGVQRPPHLFHLGDPKPGRDLGVRPTTDLRRYDDGKLKRKRGVYGIRSITRCTRDSVGGAGQGVESFVDHNVNGGRL